MKPGDGLGGPTLSSKRSKRKTIKCLFLIPQKKTSTINLQLEDWQYEN
jgi:hypothetical protein